MGDASLATRLLSTEDPEEARELAATLEALTREGIRFTILSPYQAVRVRPPGGEWQDAAGARFDPTRPYRVRAGERDIVVFFYDGHIARDLAFGDALASADRLLRRLGFDNARCRIDDRRSCLSVCADRSDIVRVRTGKHPDAGDQQQHDTGTGRQEPGFPKQRQQSG